MKIDEQLLRSRESETSGDRAGALKEAQRGAGIDTAGGQVGGQAEDQINQPQSLREAAQAEKIKQAKVGLKGKAVPVAAAPINRGASKLLQQSWLHLVDSFGLSLIWINIHVWLGSIFGNKFFCKLGAEWVDQNIAGAQADYAKSHGKIIGTVEPMGLACCDAGCLLILIIIFIVIKIIIGILTGDWQTYKTLFLSCWDAFASFVGL